MILVLLLTACQNTSSIGPTAPTPTSGPTPTRSSVEAHIPVLDHVIVILFENRSYQQVIDGQDTPTFNSLAKQNVLLTNYHAAAHPSLPNYLAIIGGDTFGITSDCTNCFINQPSLPDLIADSGRTWKTYQEDLPSPCFVGNAGQYFQKHDPFIYFDPIRTNPTRCDHSIVPLKQLETDLAANQLPDYAFIMPNICHSAHDCTLSVADQWLNQLMQKLLGTPALGKNYLIAITFDESAPGDNSSCCGMPASAGGNVATILISPQAKSGYQDSTPLSHYSLLKTILLSWQLPELGYTALSSTEPITAIWK